jgi:hypothetical protein
MSVLIGTLCLNEMEWLPKLYAQHKNWPNLKRWVFVESADIAYARTNPTLVSSHGLSVDGTTEFLEDLAKQDDRVVHIPFGFSKDKELDQGKCASRQMYMAEAGIVKPKYVLALDADEFYTVCHQQQIDSIDHTKDGTLLKYYNIWRPPSISEEPLFNLEIIGKFWRIGVCKIWKWFPGLCYKGNHNAPYHDGVYSNRNMNFLEKLDHPKFIHLGFASTGKYRNAKNDYYADRGESINTPHYVASRGAFATWRPGDVLPNGDKVIPYTGPVPEVFND